MVRCTNNEPTTCTNNEPTDNDRHWSIFRFIFRSLFNTEYSLPIRCSYNPTKTTFAVLKADKSSRNEETLTKISETIQKFHLSSRLIAKIQIEMKFQLYRRFSFSFLNNPYHEKFLQQKTNCDTECLAKLLLW